MTIYKIKYILDMDEDYYMFFDDAIEAGKNYIDKIAMEEKRWLGQCYNYLCQKLFKQYA